MSRTLAPALAPWAAPLGAGPQDGREAVGRCLAGAAPKMVAEAAICRMRLTIARARRLRDHTAVPR
ncbi:hypothetical protein [Pseudogemmobacter humi]|uniref:hypothetical protein n=1 Tax=Pseudogemmobacter humi TaxID=2483812 RepID=UPI000F528EC8|nr:hypothetical protein [Pseudogemmobacter humi]